MRRFGVIMAVVAALAVPAISQAALSGNLLNADFESTSYLKNGPSYDGNNLAIGPHRFNSDLTSGDWGKWLGRWGPPSMGGIGGFSSVDYPRQVGNTMVGQDLGNNNVSLDPYNPGSGNHIMETIAFYPTMIQWVKAPANQTTGAMQLKFDFFLNHWQADTSLDWYDQFDIQVYGSNFAPQHNIGLDWSPVDSAYTSGIGSAFSPTGGATSVDVTDPDTQLHYRSQMLARFGWGGSWTNWDARRLDQPYTESGGWKSMNSSNPTAWHDVDETDWGSLIIPVSLTETFQYYSVTIATLIYNESHDYFWQVPGYGVNGNRASDTGTAIGFDNIDFQVSVANAVLRGDVNLDGLVNALDISPFVSRLTSGAYQAEADINVDMLVNALDISGFVTCLVNGACAGVAGGSAVPEPASLVLLGLSALALVRRR